MFFAHDPEREFVGGDAQKATAARRNWHRNARHCLSCDYQRKGPGGAFAHEPPGDVACGNGGVKRRRAGRAPYCGEQADHGEQAEQCPTWEPFPTMFETKLLIDRLIEGRPFGFDAPQVSSADIVSDIMT